MDIAIIPSYNEQNHLREVINRTSKFVDYIVLVNDGSTDDTNELLFNLKNNYSNLIILNHLVNMGKGAALRTGTEYAIKHIVDNKKDAYLIFIDSDLQHKPEDIPKLVKKLKEEDLDIVFGCRKINKKMPFIYRVGNYGLNKIIYFLTGVYLPDTQSGFRVFRLSIYNKIKWTSSDYSVESEIIAHVGKYKLKFGIVNIDTIYKNKYKGTTILDGLKIFFNIVLWKFI